MGYLFTKSHTSFWEPNDQATILNPKSNYPTHFLISYQENPAIGVTHFLISYQETPALVTPSVSRCLEILQLLGDMISDFRG